MKKNLLFLICIFMISILCSGLASCSVDGQNDSSLDTQQSAEQQSSANTDVQVSENINIKLEDYSIITSEGNQYIVFDDIMLYESGGQMPASLEFSSIKDFKDKVTQGKLEDWQKKTIATAFPKDDVGVLTCDFNKLYAPDMPMGCKVTGVSWRGEFYSFHITIDNEAFGHFHYYTKSQCDNLFKTEYEDFFNKDNVLIKETKVIDGNKTKITYKIAGSEFTKVRYELSEGNKSIVVDKTYYLDVPYYDWTDITLSSTVPYNINLYCNDNGIYYIVNMYNFVDDPADSWLMQFGMSPYIDDTVAK